VSAAALSLETPGVRALLVAAGLDPSAPAVFTPLAGGVSSDIVRVEAGGASIVLKRALSRLKVEAEWIVPTDRSLNEARWLVTVAGIDPTIAPRVLAVDEARAMFALEWLPPERHPLWKARLLAGDVDGDFAAAVGRALSRIHRATLDDAAIARAFDTTASFRLLRLDPYFLALIPRRPTLEGPIRRIVAETEAARRALVHGDVSPKNILIGPRGPILLDAECAWFGDPAFDPAFCLNHLLLKGVHLPGARAALRGAFTALLEAYGADWPAPAWGAIERRIARLLPALLLARIDGKSPVEYITAEGTKAAVRQAAAAMLADPPETPDAAAERLFDAPGL
jgi:aminoglycoside phosphotransferase (APT) family kinase protein